MPRGVYIRTEKIKQKMSKAKKGENNPMYGKSLYSVWLTLYGKEEADIKQNKLIEKRTKTIVDSGVLRGKNNPLFGKHHTKEARKKYL